MSKPTQQFVKLKHFEKAKLVLDKKGGLFNVVKSSMLFIELLIHSTKSCVWGH